MLGCDQSCTFALPCSWIHILDALPAAGMYWCAAHVFSVRFASGCCQPSLSMAYRSQTRSTTAKQLLRYQKRTYVRLPTFHARKFRLDGANAASSCSSQALAQTAEYAAAWPGVKEGSWKWKGYNVRCASAVLCMPIHERLCHLCCLWPKPDHENCVPADLQAASLRLYVLVYWECAVGPGVHHEGAA